MFDDYRRVLALSGCSDLLRRAGRVVVYPNLTWNRFFPSVSSPPWQLDALAAAVPPHDGWRWVAGTGHTARPLRGAQCYYWPEALSRHHQTFEPLRLRRLPAPLPYPPGQRLLALDRIQPAGLPIPASFQDTVAVHLPTLKTHGQVGLAGAAENAWCTWLSIGGGAAATYPHDVLLDFLLLQRKIHQAVCAVMDGTIAGGGAGPRTVQPRETNLLLASTDPVALDAIAAKVAGLDPLSLRYLVLAYALGLGVADPDEIEVAGDDISHLNLHLRVRRPPAALARNVLEQMSLERLESWLFRHRRWVGGISNLYYDSVWYRTIGLRRLVAFRHSAWGRLFASYAPVEQQRSVAGSH